MHECNCHVQAKSGFQLMRRDGQFSQKWSHIDFSALGIKCMYYLRKVGDY